MIAALLAVLRTIAIALAGEAARRAFAGAAPAALPPGSVYASPAEAPPAQSSKGLLLSKTFWGIVIGAVAAALPNLGIATEGATFYADQTVAILAALFAIWGRYQAEKPIAR